MAEIVRLDDLEDPRLRDYVDLRDVQLRLRLEADRGLFLAEGEKVVRRAIESGHQPRSFLMSPRWLDGLGDLLEATDVPCFVLDDKSIEKLTGFHVHRGALAALQRPEPRPPRDVLANAHTFTVFRHNIVYFVAGRSAGLIPYFFPGIVCAVLSSATASAVPICRG